MDSENYNPKELFRGDSKYIAVMPMVRSIYDEAKIVVMIILLLLLK